ncbi:hypothetical protein [Microbacterium paraoxydans]|uniref:hypothetical protein n=1 Tax=Microbacterium paraoxydans TaxID=199592 RepID=UPI001CF999DC|nr:hypothetical protein [Microbacterium paraoxydans]
MISTLSIWNDLAPLYGGLGYAGLTVALIGAVAVGVAGVVDHPEAVGISVGAWFTGLLLSCCAFFTGHVWLMAVAAAALPAAATVALVSRFALRRARRAAPSVGTMTLHPRGVQGAENAHALSGH